MIKELKESFKTNAVNAYSSYPSKTPLEFVTIKQAGIKPGIDVRTYGYEISLYSKNDMELFSSTVVDILLNVQIPFCGNISISIAEDEEKFKNKFKKQTYLFEIDKIKVN